MDSLAFFATHSVFTRDDYVAGRKAAGKHDPRTADSLLRKHLATGRITRVRRGLYVTVPPGANPETVQADRYLIATKAAEDATVSHHAALQFHGRSYSVWDQVTFLSLRNLRAFRFRTTQFLPLKPPKEVAKLPEFGGGVKIIPHAGGKVRVTTLERTMVDLFHTPSHGGGWEEIWRSLEMVEFFDLDAVIRYTLTLGSALTTARVGFFLEQHSDKLFVEERHLKKLAAYAPRQTRYFDHSREPGQLMKRWHLIVPKRVLHREWEEMA